MGEARSAAVQMPGTCGELVQGRVDGLTFLISCPIDLYATVTVTIHGGGAAEVRGPADAPKAVAAVHSALTYFGFGSLCVDLDISSPLPRGKGMGSSTADVAGAIFAVALALGETISPREVSQLALDIEPSDGSMFPNVALFDHRTGRHYEDLGSPPAVDIAVLVFDGAVDTVQFNMQDWSTALAATEPAVAEAAMLVRRGIREGRPELIGRGASISAEANQRILFKPALPVVQELARELGALGVNVGHSGTIIGILLDPKKRSAEEALAVAYRRLPDVKAGFACRLISGGYRVPAFAK